MLDVMEIKSEARLRWFGLLKRESIGRRMLRPKLPGWSFIDVARGKSEEEVPEEGLNANSWSAVLNPKAKGRNNTCLFRQKRKIYFYCHCTLNVQQNLKARWRIQF